jgi:phosphoserine phosphatase RsbU/P
VRRIFPKSRMGIFTVILVALWILKSLLLTPRIRQVLSAGQQFSVDLLTVLLAVPALYYSWKLLAVLRRKLLWKIRRRLIVAHIFIGGIPALLIVVIIGVAVLLFYYQLSYYLISNQIGIHAGQIHALNLSLRATLDQTMVRSAPGPSELRTIFDEDVQYILGEYPSAAVILRVEETSTRSVVSYGNRNVNIDLLRKYQVPLWMNEREFSGLAVEDSQSELYKSADSARQAGGGQLFLRSFVSSDSRPEMPFTIEVSVPFDLYLLERIKAAVGQELLLVDHLPVTGRNIILQTTDLLRGNVLGTTIDNVGANTPELDRSVWSIVLFPISWNSGIERGAGDTQVLFVELSLSRLFQKVFRSESQVSKTILGVLQIVVGFFLVAEAVSLVIGILLTKSITNAVYNLYRGTQFVKRGDFSHRIMVKADDQLGALAESFNQMTEYVQTLVKERVQKERLERELEIAKEVQEQLFPRKAPQLGRMDLAGLCLPARIVSGDYYDFLQIDGNRLGLALGDICGKGISAALLMANLQATLRSNVTGFSERLSVPPAPLNGAGDVARVVKKINDQIYRHTSANKYATFFYAVYDDSRSTLTYCNAGHNPPLFFDRQTCARLSAGGTVVGIFPDAEFEEETVKLNSGDLFLAYSDGIVESVNEYGEEFGEERLIRLVTKHRSLTAAQIQGLIVEQVLEWSFEEERDDDMTLIVAKIS